MEDDFLNPFDALLKERAGCTPRQPAVSFGVGSSLAEDIASASCWDRLFAENDDEHVFGKEPSAMARLAFAYWKEAHGDLRGPLLDLGCGEGRDSVFFAQHGFDVTAVDGSEAGLAKTARLARDAHVGMTRVLCDLRRYLPPYAFSFVYAHNSLQFLGADCLPYLEALRDRTPAGGLNAVSVFTSEAVPEREGVYRFDRGELRDRYGDWQVLSASESVIWREPIRGYLSFAQIVARKP